MDLVDGLPPSVAKIAEHLARMARGYSNRLKWNEQAMFKADLMNERRRWYSVELVAFSTKLRREGMREEDIERLVESLSRAQAGKRLIPQRSYRAFRFGFPSEGAEPIPFRTSREW